MQEFFCLKKCFRKFNIFVHWTSIPVLHIRCSGSLLLICSYTEVLLMFCLIWLDFFVLDLRLKRQSAQKNLYWCIFWLVLQAEFFLWRFIIFLDCTESFWWAPAERFTEFCLPMRFFFREAQFLFGDWFQFLRRFWSLLMLWLNFLNSFFRLGTELHIRFIWQDLHLPGCILL